MSKSKKSASVTKPKPEPINPHFTTCEWHGLKMFKCSKCPWSTLNENEMMKHTAKHMRTEPQIKQTVATGLVAPSGNPIVREIEATDIEEEGDTHGE